MCPSVSERMRSGAGRAPEQSRLQAELSPPWREDSSTFSTEIPRIAIRALPVASHHVNSREHTFRETCVLANLLRRCALTALELSTNNHSGGVLVVTDDDRRASPDRTALLKIQNRRREPIRDASPEIRVSPLLCLREASCKVRRSQVAPPVCAGFTGRAAPNEWFRQGEQPQV
jgi:hypothetical protein